jgi:caffeoyl-CoA O-methyltransferase
MTDPQITRKDGRCEFRQTLLVELISADATGYADDHTTPLAGQLQDVAAWTAENTTAPQMMSGTAEARLLQALIVVGGATSVLEIGTFTGLGALAMAAALPASGRVTTLEVDEEMAGTARRHIDASPHREKIDLIVGDALHTLGNVEGPFDLVYIDAWKADYPQYYEAVIPKLAERGVIVADNMFRGGRALDAESDDPGDVGIREFARRVQDDPRVDNVMLTVGDGLMLAWRSPRTG